MKVVVLGAGALGSIMAGHLARAGEDVTLVARGERAAYLTDHGITVTGLAEFNVPCAVVTDPSQINQADVLIVAVKTHQMDEAISGLSHIRFSAVTTVQNGVRANDQLAEVFGAGSTLGGVASFSGEMLPEGDVRFTVNAGFQIGELPEGSSDRVKDLCTMLRDAARFRSKFRSRSEHTNAPMVEIRAVGRGDVGGCSHPPGELQVLFGFRRLLDLRPGHARGRGYRR